jgi:hypothetical protein
MTPPRPGDRIRLVAMPDDPDPIPPGSTGTVTSVHPHGTGPNRWFQVLVDWDRRRLKVLAGSRVNGPLSWADCLVSALRRTDDRRQSPLGPRPTPVDCVSARPRFADLTARKSELSADLNLVSVF